MGKKPVVTATKIALNIALVIFITLFVFSIFTNLFNPEFIRMNRTLNLIVTSIVGVAVIYLLITLKNIVKTVESNEPFCKENVQRFKLIGYSIFFIGLVDTIVRYPLNKNGALLVTSYGSVSEVVFIYLVLGCLTLLLSEIFNQAMEIKEENDMTI